ncbi:PP2A regulatory subunit TAP46-like [Lotus japonicus]|uniref:PP2A regulatory subunit TAP46-like n=1 Tax=Lotus japonicus TaxID=34305 RepID=UPI00258B8F36|nr:PP2A regulatory subunit TAP46-like [Lotus japonicus]
MWVLIMENLSNNAFPPLCSILEPTRMFCLFHSAMGDTRVEELPLPALFEQAREIHATANADQKVVKKGYETLQKCEDMVNKLGLFSSNETKEDISTGNLKYILALVPFYLAEMTEQIAQDDRIQIVKASQTKLKEFISFCEAMELVPKEELESYTQGAPKSVADQRARKNLARNITRGR